MKRYFEILTVLLVLFLSALSQAQYPDRDRYIVQDAESLAPVRKCMVCSARKI
jgi:hypothetical protein